MITLSEMESRGLTLLEMLDIAAKEPTDQSTLKWLVVDAAAELRRRDAALANAIRQAEAVGQYWRPRIG